MAMTTEDSGAQTADRLSDRRLQFDYFDRVTPTYALGRLDFARRLVAEEGKPSARILDVGCGDGSLLRAMAGDHPGVELVGIDPAASYVASARQQGVEASVGSVLDPGLLASLGRFDYVVLASVLHHLVGRSWAQSRRNAELAMIACIDALEPDGRLVIFETCLRPTLISRAAFCIKLLTVGLGRNRRLDLGWVNLGAPLVAFFDEAELMALVERCGGRVVRRQVVSQRSHLRFVTRRGIGLIVGRTLRATGPQGTSG